MFRYVKKMIVVLIVFEVMYKVKYLYRLFKMLINIYVYKIFCLMFGKERYLFLGVFVYNISKK